MTGQRPLLAATDLRAGYGDSSVLEGISLTVAAGEVVCLLGANGVGKTTTLMTIAGILQPTAGDVQLDGQSLRDVPAHQRVARGIALAPEGRQVFANCTVRENLLLGSFTPRARRQRQEKLQQVFELFPRLLERERQIAGLMSGGEQQMLAIGRALMSDPRLLMLDEPSLGLAPKILLAVYDAIARVASLGISILLVEQNVATALTVATRGYVLAHGRVVSSGTSDELRDTPAIHEAFFGTTAAPVQAAASPAVR